MVERTDEIKRRAGIPAVCACVLAVLFLGMLPVQAAEKARTLPVHTSAVKQQKKEQAKVPSPVAASPKRLEKTADVAAKGGAVGPKTVEGATKATSAKAKAARRKAASHASGAFSGDPLFLGQRAPADDQKKTRVVYGAEGQRREAPVTLGEEGKVVMSAKKLAVPESRLTPARTAFSGSEHTLPYMDSKQPPEVSMQYELQDNASARVTVNPQDSASPLYRPAERDGTVSSAGVYMDVAVKPDVQLQVGGEYSDVDSRSGSAGASQGASVGLKWDF